MKKELKYTAIQQSKIKKMNKSQKARYEKELEKSKREDEKAINDLIDLVTA